MATATETRTKELSNDQIQIDGGTQARVKIDETVVEEYAELRREGVELPPVEACFDGSHYWMFDGFHRYLANLRAGFGTITCVVSHGTKEDAQWLAFSANREHGLRRSNADKRKATMMALQHPNGSEMSDNALAEHVGVSPRFVSKMRQELIPTTHRAQSNERVGRDGRKINTSSIGKSTAHGAQSDDPEPDTSGDPQPWPGDGSEEPDDIEFRGERSADDFYEGDVEDAEPITDEDWEPGESDVALKRREAIKRRDDAIVKGFGTLVRLVDEQANELDDKGNGTYLRTIDDLNDTLRTFRTWRGLAT